MGDGVFEALGLITYHASKERFMSKVGGTSSLAAYYGFFGEMVSIYIYIYIYGKYKSRKDM